MHPVPRVQSLFLSAASSLVEGVYALRIPLGGIRPGLGAKFAFSIRLNDGDGQKRAAYMTWGGGISPTWKPARFGVATFVK